MSEHVEVNQTENHEVTTQRVRGGTAYSVPAPPKSETHVQGLKTAIVSFILGAVALVVGYTLSGVVWQVTGALSAVGLVAVFLAVKSRNQGYRSILRTAALVVSIGATILCIVVMFSNIAVLCTEPILDITTPVTH